MKTLMDVIQFGKWVSERRRKCGWSSQRALAETLRNDAFLQEWRISEDFIARLEAGRLAYPFRGQVRQQILVLAQVLCKSSREVQAYLHAASLKELSPEETLLVQRIHDYLAQEQVSTVELLPIRPALLIGREELVQNVLAQVRSQAYGLYAITGMPGVGKSVFAHEIFHRIATDEYRRLFHDGIIMLSCKGRQGTAGLISLLHEVIEIFANVNTKRKAMYIDQVSSGRDSSGSGRKQRLSDSPYDEATEAVGTLIDRVRMVLAHKSVCFLLDDLEPQLPLRDALDALCGNAQYSGTDPYSGPARRIVLTTSRFLPSGVHIDYHCALDVLEPGDASALFRTLAAPALPDHSALCSVDMTEREKRESSLYRELQACDNYIEHICIGLGCLPLAIMHTAHALVAERIPLPLLANNVVTEPLNPLLSAGKQLQTMFAQALDCFEPATREKFALLALFGEQSFSLEAAATLYACSTTDQRECPTSLITARYSSHTEASLSMLRDEADTATAYLDRDMSGASMTERASTAMMLGRLVQMSLLQWIGGVTDTFTENPRYVLHPLLYAYARLLLRKVPAEHIKLAQGTLLDYADAYVERYQGNSAMLEDEQAFLLAALDTAWQQKEYTRVVRFSARLVPIVDHLDSAVTGIELLRRGIYASEQTKDSYHLSYLNGYLGLLYYYQEYREAARQCWQEALALADELDAPAHLWRPYLYLAHLAYVQNDVPLACSQANAFLERIHDAGDLHSLATAYLKRGSYKRKMGDIDQAHDDICTALSYLFMLGVRPSSPEQILELEARAELACVLGDYQSSTHYLEAVHSLLSTNSDPYTRALLSLDKIRLSHEHARHAETGRKRLEQSSIMIES